YIRRRTIEPVAERMERLWEGITRRVFGLLARLALVISFATTSSIFLLGGTFAAIGIDLFEAIDHASIFQTVALHAVAIASIVVLVRALGFLAQDQMPELEVWKHATNVMPMALAFAAVAVWYLPLAIAGPLIAVTCVGCWLTARISITAMVIFGTLAFFPVGIARAVSLHQGEAPTLLTRAGRAEPFTIIVSANRGLLGFAGTDKTVEFVPWEQVQSLRSTRSRGWLGWSPAAGPIGTGRGK
ncbi:MAG TPA: hypothetical protein PK264_03055, partial [Hyphomicrobiaceae bacterium]|nr:hypothetical protein [Hyphomicrobiaceae bacterium]